MTVMRPHKLRLPSRASKVAPVKDPLTPLATGVGVAVVFVGVGVGVGVGVLVGVGVGVGVAEVLAAGVDCVGDGVALGMDCAVFVA